jgi:transposase
MNKDSGKIGYRSISGGRLSVRCSLYMAAITAIRHNTLIRSFYTRLREKGKPAKIALVHCQDKFVIFGEVQDRAFLV